MKSRSVSEWVKAYYSIHQELTVKGFKPKLQTLDNEASTVLKNFLTANNIAYQLVPPHCHRRNASGRAIRTSKERFLAGLSSVDPSFPMHLWDRLLSQVEITLNLLRTSQLHPQLSAATHFHGLVDYKKADSAPPGCKIIAHEKPGKRRTWAPQGQHGYSLGSAMHHYRCQNVYITTTASERIVDTLEYFPHNYQIPQFSSTGRLLMTAKDTTDAFQNPHPDVPLAIAGDDTIAALSDLAVIFKLKLQFVPHNSSFAAQIHPTPKPHSLVNADLELANARQPANEITHENYHSRHPQWVITSEGGHPEDTTSFISEGAH
jgi:hypothetical protein